MIDMDPFHVFLLMMALFCAFAGGVSCGALITHNQRDKEDLRKKGFSKQPSEIPSWQDPSAYTDREFQDVVEAHKERHDEAVPITVIGYKKKGEEYR